MLLSFALPLFCHGRRRFAAIVCLEYDEVVSGKDMMLDIKSAFGPGGLGILYVRGVPGFSESRAKLLPLSRHLALQPQDVLQKYERQDAFYNVGWSRGREQFQGKPDNAKGSFYVNPIYDDPANGDPAIPDKYPFIRPNMWPEEVPQLEGAVKGMGGLVYDTAKKVLEQVDRLVAHERPGHGTRLSDFTFRDSRCVLGRLLHYYAESESESVGSWCGWHNDNSTITGLVPAMWLDEDSGMPAQAPEGAGLFVQGRGSEVIQVRVPEDCIGFQIGEAAQILSGGVVHATPHMVRGHVSKEGLRLCRETFAMFIEPNWDAAISPPDGVGYEAIFEGREASQLIPPLRKRLPKVPVEFGQLLGDSFAEYFAMNNGPADGRGDG